MSRSFRCVPPSSLAWAIFWIIGKSSHEQSRSFTWDPDDWGGSSRTVKSHRVTEPCSSTCPDLSVLQDSKLSTRFNQPPIQRFHPKHDRSDPSSCHSKEGLRGKPQRFLPRSLLERSKENFQGEQAGGSIGLGLILHSSTFLTDTHSDLVVMCSERRWPVHCAIVCSRSAIFNKACDRSFKVDESAC